MSERDRAVVPEVFAPNIIAPLFGLPVGFPIPITEPDGAFTVAFDESIDEQYAAFTNLDYKLTDKLTVAATWVACFRTFVHGRDCPTIQR